MDYMIAGTYLFILSGIGAGITMIISPPDDRWRNWYRWQVTALTVSWTLFCLGFLTSGVLQ